MKDDTVTVDVTDTEGDVYASGNKTWRVSYVYCGERLKTWLSLKQRLLKQSIVRKGQPCLLAVSSLTQNSGWKLKLGGAENGDNDYTTCNSYKLQKSEKTSK